MSAAAQLYRSTGEMLLAALCVLPEAAQSFLPRPVRTPWAIAWLLGCLVILTFAGKHGFGSLSKDREESARGYTTILKTAKERQDLYLLHRHSFAVLSAPFTPRPETLGVPFLS